MTLVLASLFVMSASAKNIAHVHKGLKLLSEEEGTGRVVLTNRMIIPAGQLIFQEVRLYTGFSRTAPCSDLVLVNADSDNEAIEIDQGFTVDDVILSDELSRTLGYGKTCMKVEMVVNSKLFSSGNIQLIWDRDNDEYTQAIPSGYTIDLRDAVPQA